MGMDKNSDLIVSFQIVYVDISLEQKDQLKKMFKINYDLIEQEMNLFPKPIF